MQPHLVFFIVGCSALLGYLGRNKALKFWGHFLLSLFLSPIIGLLTIGLEEWIEQRSAKPAAAPQAS